MTGDAMLIHPTWMIQAQICSIKWQVGIWLYKSLAALKVLHYGGGTAAAVALAAAAAAAAAVVVVVVVVVVLVLVVVLVVVDKKNIQ